jgi:hypothetical protein
VAPKDLSNVSSTDLGLDVPLTFPEAGGKVSRSYLEERLSHTLLGGFMIPSCDDDGG